MDPKTFEERSANYNADQLEMIAKFAHSRWASWMMHMLNQGEFAFRPGPRGLPEPVWIMPPELLDRWGRQATSSYGDLSSKAQMSDLEEAMLILDAVKKAKWETRSPGGMANP